MQGLDMVISDITVGDSLICDTKKTKALSAIEKFNFTFSLSPCSSSLFVSAVEVAIECGVFKFSLKQMRFKLTPSIEKVESKMPANILSDVMSRIALFFAFHFISVRKCMFYNQIRQT